MTEPQGIEYAPQSLIDQVNAGLEEEVRLLREAQEEWFEEDDDAIDSPHTGIYENLMFFPILRMCKGEIVFTDMTVEAKSEEQARGMAANDLHELVWGIIRESNGIKKRAFSRFTMDQNRRNPYRAELHYVNQDPDARGFVAAVHGSIIQSPVRWPDLVMEPKFDESPDWLLVEPSNRKFEAEGVKYQVIISRPETLSANWDNAGPFLCGQKYHFRFGNEYQHLEPSALLSFSHPGPNTFRYRGNDATILSLWEPFIPGLRACVEYSQEHNRES